MLLRFNDLVILTGPLTSASQPIARDAILALFGQLRRRLYQQEARSSMVPKRSSTCAFLLGFDEAFGHLFGE